MLTFILHRFNQYFRLSHWLSRWTKISVACAIVAIMVSGFGGISAVYNEVKRWAEEPYSVELQKIYLWRKMTHHWNLWKIYHTNMILEIDNSCVTKFSLLYIIVLHAKLTEWPDWEKAKPSQAIWRYKCNWIKISRIYFESI